MTIQNSLNRKITFSCFKHEKWIIILVISIFSILFFVQGCGVYTFSGNVPGHLKTIAIPTFENQTAEFEVVELITEAVEKQFREDNTLKIRDLRNADSILYGTIIRIDDNPTTYSSDESVEEYKITITVNVRFEDRVKDKIVWEESISGYGIYPFSGGSQAERDEGMEEAVDKLAEDIVNKTVSGW